MIAKVIAIDSDSVHNSRITYQFLHNTDATLFSLDQYNGEIRTMRMFSYRDSRHQQLVVIAKDNGEPALSATVTIKLSTVEIALKTYADMTEVPLGYDIFSDLNLYLVIGLGSVSFLLLITILVTIVLKCQKTKPSKAAPPCRNSVISERNSTIADSTLVSNDAYWYSLFLAETRKGKLVVRQPVPKGARYIVSSIPRSTGLTETSDSAASTLQCSKSTDYSSKYLQDTNYDGTLCHSIQYRSGDKRYMLVGPRMSIGSTIVPGSNGNTLVIPDRRRRDSGECSKSTDYSSKYLQDTNYDGTLCHSIQYRSGDKRYMLVGPRMSIGSTIVPGSNGNTLVIPDRRRRDSGGCSKSTDYSSKYLQDTNYDGTLCHSIQYRSGDKRYMLVGPRMSIGSTIVPGSNGNTLVIPDRRRRDSGECSKSTDYSSKYLQDTNYDGTLCHSIQYRSGDKRYMLVGPRMSIGSTLVPGSNGNTLVIPDRRRRDSGECSKSTDYSSKYLQDANYDGTLCHSIQYRSGDKRYMLVGPRMSIGSTIVPGSNGNTLVIPDRRRRDSGECSKSTDYSSKYLQDANYDGTLCHSIQYRSGDKRYMLVGPRMSIGSTIVPGSNGNTLVIPDRRRRDSGECSKSTDYSSKYLQDTNYDGTLCHSIQYRSGDKRYMLVGPRMSIGSTIVPGSNGNTLVIPDRRRRDSGEDTNYDGTLCHSIQYRSGDKRYMLVGPRMSIGSTIVPGSNGNTLVIPDRRRRDSGGCSKSTDYSSKYLQDTNYDGTLCHSIQYRSGDKRYMLVGPRMSIGSTIVPGSNRNTLVIPDRRRRDSGEDTNYDGTLCHSIQYRSGDKRYMLVGPRMSIGSTIVPGSNGNTLVIPDRRRRDSGECSKSTDYSSKYLQDTNYDGTLCHSIQYRSGDKRYMLVGPRMSIGSTIVPGSNGNTLVIPDRRRRDSGECSKSSNYSSKYLQDTNYDGTLCHSIQYRSGDKRYMLVGPRMSIGSTIVPGSNGNTLVIPDRRRRDSGEDTNYDGTLCHSIQYRSGDKRYMLVGPRMSIGSTIVPGSNGNTLVIPDRRRRDSGECAKSTDYSSKYLQDTNYDGTLCHSIQYRSGDKRYMLVGPRMSIGSTIVPGSNRNTLVIPDRRRRDSGEDTNYDGTLCHSIQYRSGDKRYMLVGPRMSIGSTIVPGSNGNTPVIPDRRRRDSGEDTNYDGTLCHSIQYRSGDKRYMLVGPRMSIGSTIVPGSNGNTLVIPDRRRRDSGECSKSTDYSSKYLQDTNYDGTLCHSIQYRSGDKRYMLVGPRMSIGSTIVPGSDGNTLVIPDRRRRDSGELGLSITDQPLNVDLFLFLIKVAVCSKSTDYSSKYLQDTNYDGTLCHSIQYRSGDKRYMLVGPRMSIGSTIVPGSNGNTLVIPDRRRRDSGECSKSTDYSSKYLQDTNYDGTLCHSIQYRSGDKRYMLVGPRMSIGSTIAPGSNRNTLVIPDRRRRDSGECSKSTDYSSKYLQDTNYDGTLCHSIQYRSGDKRYMLVGPRMSIGSTIAPGSNRNTLVIPDRRRRDSGECSKSTDYSSKYLQDTNYDGTLCHSIQYRSGDKRYMLVGPRMSIGSTIAPGSNRNTLVIPDRRRRDSGECSKSTDYSSKYLQDTNYDGTLCHSIQYRSGDKRYMLVGPRMSIGSTIAPGSNRNTLVIPDRRRRDSGECSKSTDYSSKYLQDTNYDGTLCHSIQYRSGDKRYMLVGPRMSIGSTIAPGSNRNTLVIPDRRRRDSGECSKSTDYSSKYLQDTNYDGTLCHSIQYRSGDKRYMLVGPRMSIGSTIAPGSNRNTLVIPDRRRRDSGEKAKMIFNMKESE
ncbi:protocadherin alpha-C2-like isoform X2 [Labeo rohita]|uniref:Protocadherin alpha-C2-like isoform X2 n=1 Tax=Labeo rohita TaxID=84645 RepID=A0A498MUL8_LABRO|nr:protocadherin alpha-C2-like isoform X2 [Labeo rohita]